MRDSQFGSLDEAADAYRGWLLEDALPVWWERGADRTQGGFHDALFDDDRPGRPIRRARVQCRQAFTYAILGELGWSGPWRQAARHGWRYFAAHHLRPDGLYRATTRPDGSPLDEEAYLYDQAFALLALAALHEHDPGGGDDAGAARRLLQALQDRRHGAGYREAGGQPFQANAHMHILEACSAWAALGERAFHAAAAEVVELALARFIDPDGGFLREFFDADWRPAAGADGELVEPGHQFEWAWLLSRWSRLAGDPAAGEAAARLFAAGLKGLDADRQVAVDALSPRLEISDRNARLWPQTEYLKAALEFHRPDHALQAANGLWRYLRRPGRGLWWDKQRPDGSFEAEPAPASSFYHIAMACRELLAFVGPGGA